MRIIAFITAPATVRRMLDRLGEPTRPPRCAPARGPPLWEAAAAAPSADNDPLSDHDPLWVQDTQPLPQFEFDQRLA